MVLGLGMDIVDLEGFREQLSDIASRFVEGSFTLRERRDAESRPGQDVSRHLAARYAAKEAFIKAWSIALQGQPPPLPHVDMKEIELVTDAWKRPSLRLYGTVHEAFASVGAGRILVSLSHDGGFAAAVVVLEAFERTVE